MVTLLLLFACAPSPSDKPAGDTGAPGDDTAGDSGDDTAGDTSRDTSDTSTDTAPDTDTADTAVDTDTADDTSGDTSDTSDTSAPDGWNGEGAYRLVLTVPGYDPGSRIDQGPAAVRLNFTHLLDGLGETRAPDLATFQLVREAEDGTPLPPPALPAEAIGPYDVPFRYTDQPLEEQDFTFNIATDSAYGTLSFVHVQDGAADTRYALYFDVTDAPAPIAPSRPLLGDGDMIWEAEGWLGTQIHTRPFLVDLDEDGLVDLVTGDSLGYVTLYRNTGTADAPEWTEGEWLTTTDGAAINEGLLAIPDVVDWDGDGDLDLLVGSETGAIITYFSNEGGLLFEDQGRLEADGRELRLPPSPVAEVDFYTQDYTAAPEAVDHDDDGDLDLLVGGYVTGRIFVFENTRDGAGEPVLTRAMDLTADGEAIDTWWAASPATVDLDADGDLDLISGGMNWEPTAEDLASFPWVWYWENVDGAYTEVALPMTAGLPVTRGNLTAPRPGDIDGDGDSDIVVATDSRVYVLRNVGDATTPSFTPEEALPQAWTPLMVSADAQPVDLDGDGDLDFSRGGGASVSWTENLGDADPPSFEGHGSLAAGGAEIVHTFEDGDDTSFPAWHDWDADGDLDLVMGTGDGLVWLYRNEGGSPTEDLAAGERLYLTDGTLLHVGEARAPEDFEGHSGDRSQPAPADLDGDGDTDLLVGDAYGSITVFYNAGDDTFGPGEIVAARSVNRAAISAADWDDDGDIDLIDGQDGGIWIYPNEGDATAFVLGDPTYVETATIYYPHPYPADFNGDGDLDLVVSSSYYYVYYFERTALDGGVLEASVTTVEHVDGASAGVDPGGDASFAFEGDTPPSYGWPSWTPFPTEGTSADGAWILAADQSAYLGTIFSADGDDRWVGTATTEVEIRLRVSEVSPGNTDTLAVAVSDGAANWHVRFAPDAVSFYGYPDRYTVDTSDWHTWRLAIDGETLTLCRDDDPSDTWSSAPSFTYARNALWVGDDGGGTGGDSAIDWIRWTHAGDGDPCTGW